MASQQSILIGLVEDLDNEVKEIEQKIEAWVTDSTNEKANVERSKHRYIKLEKWNIVI